MSDDVYIIILWFAYYTFVYAPALIGDCIVFFPSTFLYRSSVNHIVIIYVPVHYNCMWHTFNTPIWFMFNINDRWCCEFERNRRNYTTGPVRANYINIVFAKNVQANN